MQRITYTPAALCAHPGPAEKEIFVKAPSLSHNERPMEDESIG